MLEFRILIRPRTGERPVAAVTLPFTRQLLCRGKVRPRQLHTKLACPGLSKVLSSRFLVSACISQP